MIRLFVVGVALVVAGTVLGAAEDAPRVVLGRVEYLGGKAGLPKRMQGQLVVDAAAVLFVGARVSTTGRNIPGSATTFALPLTTIVKVTERDEVVYLQVETADGAEVVRFEVSGDRGLEIVAKIEFAVRQAQALARSK